MIYFTWWALNEVELKRYQVKYSICIGFILRVMVLVYKSWWHALSVFLLSFLTLGEVFLFYLFSLPFSILHLRNDDPVLCVVRPTLLYKVKGVSNSLLSTLSVHCHLHLQSVIVQRDKAMPCCWHSTLTSLTSCLMEQQHTLASLWAGKPVFITMETNRKWLCEICLQVW